MSPDAKVYPGDLPPIPFGPDVLAEWQTRWFALLDYFNIDVSLEQVEVERYLLLKLIEKHKPPGQEYLLLAVPYLNAVGIDCLLRRLCGEYLPGLSLPDAVVRIPLDDKKGRPKGSTTDAPRRNLMLFSKMQQGKPTGHTQWKPKEKISKILRRYPQLSPNTQLTNSGNSEVAAYSEYRRLAAKAAKHQKERDASLPQRFCEFLAKCNAETRSEIERCALLMSRKNQAALNGEKDLSQSLEQEVKEILLGIIYGAEWRALNQQLKRSLNEGDSAAILLIEDEIKKVELSPRCPDGLALYNLFLTASDAWMIWGESLFQEHLSNERSLD